MFPSHLSSRVAGVIFAASFLLLFAWFQAVQPFDNYFFEATRAQLLAHIAARILLLPYLFCILFGLGHVLMKALTAKTGALPITPIEEIAIAVLVGSAALRLSMFGLGFASLYYSWPLALAGTAALAAGSGRLWALLKQISLSMKEARAALPRIEYLVSAALLATIVFSIGAVLVQKYLYPFTRASGDYLSHYLPYYLEVIERRNLWPNDVWYHFYLSKGAGDFIYAMMMSDPLGAGAINMVMHIAGIIIGYAFLKRMTQDRLVSLLGTAILASAFVYTYEFPIPSAENAQFRDPWGMFDREHVLSAVLIFGALWASWLLSELPGGARRTWWKLSAACVLGLIVLRPQMAILYGGILGALLLWSIFRRDHALGRAYIGLAAVAGGSALLLWGFNFLVTGLGDVSPFQFFWRFADQEKLAAWVNPFLALLTIVGSSPGYGDLALPQLDNPLFPTLVVALRLGKILPYFALYGIPFLLAVAAALYTLRHNAAAVPQALASGLFVLLSMLAASLALFFCVHQIYSLFRIYVFCVYPVVLLGIAPFALAGFHVRHFPKYRNLFIATAGLLGLLATHGAVSAVSTTYSRMTLDFLNGSKTLARTIDEQGQLIKPDICHYAANGSRIWMFSAWGPVFMSPHCRLQMFYSYSMGPDWATIAFEEPALAVQALKKQRIDYFLIDTREFFFDLLPLSPLFSPRHIGKHFGLAWAQDGIYLLTWPSERTRTLPPKFFSDYRHYLEKSGDHYADFSGIYRQMSPLYAKWKQAPHFPIELDPARPKLRGWQ